MKTAFNQRRKTLGNALKAMPEFSTVMPKEFARKRAEELSVEQFIALTLMASA